MRKFVVLMALLVMTGMLWAQAAPAGPALTMNATLSYMETTDLAAGKEFSDKPQLELKWSWVVDDLNTAYVEIEEGPMGAGVAGFATDDSLGGYADVGNANVHFSNVVDKVWWKTDVGKAMKLPVGVTLKVGLDEWQNVDTTYVTKSDWEEFLGEKDWRTWGAQVEIMAAPVFNLRLQSAFNPEAKAVLVGVYGSQAPVSYEAAYFTNGQDPDKGWIEGGAKYVADVAPGINLGVSAAAEYDLQDLGTIGSPTWMVQAGANVIYNKMLAVGLGWRGQQEATAGGLRAELWTKPMADSPLELFVLAGLGLDDALYPETFDSLEATVMYKFGKASYWVGMIYGPEGSMGIAKETVDMDVAGMAGKGVAQNDTTAIFLRGTLAF